MRQSQTCPKEKKGKTMGGHSAARKLCRGATECRGKRGVQARLHVGGKEKKRKGGARPLMHTRSTLSADKSQRGEKMPFEPSCPSPSPPELTRSYASSRSRHT